MFLSLLFIIIQWGFAQGIGVDNCVDSGYQYGDGKGTALYLDQCYSMAQEQGDIKLIRVSALEKWRAVAFKNMIFIENKEKALEKPEVQAGSSTGLTNVVAMDFDEYNKELFVINGEDGEILVFTLNIIGNVAPLRKLTSRYLVKAEDLAVDVVGNNIFVYNSHLSNIYVFKRDAQTFERQDKQEELEVTILDVESADFIFNLKNALKLQELQKIH